MDETHPGKAENAVCTPTERRILIAVLVTLWAFIAALNDDVSLARSWLDWYDLWMGAYYLALPCLLAIWAALGCRPLTIRFPQALAGAAFLGLVEAWSSRRYPSGNPPESLLSVLMPLILVVLLSLLLTPLRRRRGWRIGLADQSDRPPATPVQFTLRQLLAWTTLVAAVLAAARWIAGKEMGAPQTSAWSSLGMWLAGSLCLGAILLLLVVPCVGMVLGSHGRGRFARWAATMGLVSFSLTYGLMLCLYYLENQPIAASELALFAKLAAETACPVFAGLLAVLLGSLVVLRVCGYRLTSASEVLPANVLKAESVARRRWRPSPFACATLALGLAAVALCWPAWRIETARRADAAQWRIAQELAQMGIGSDIYGSGLSTVDFPAGRPVSDSALKKLVELDRVVPLQKLDLSGRPLRDDQLRFLSGLAHLETLNLSDTGISDDDLVHLRALKRLSDLALAGNRITDAGLAHLVELKSVSALDLSRTNVTDKGMRDVATIPNLQCIGLDGTKITVRGVSQLLHRADALVIVYVRETPITVQDVAQINRSLPIAWTYNGGILRSYIP